jgi:hypothetical protein
MILDFSREGLVKYSLKVYNYSARNLVFYIYQRLPNQSQDGTYSLVWMASPYKISTGSFMTFIWSVDYSFFWFDTEKLTEGIIPFIGGSIPASLKTKNTTTFNIENDSPEFSPAIFGNPSDKFSIMGGDSIPNSKFSTGIGMSASATFLQQCYLNSPQSFNSNPVFWVSASPQVQLNQVLSQDTIPNSAMFSFALNQYSLTATLGIKNSWTIS